MTIAAALLTHEGAILGADSTTTVVAEDENGERLVVATHTGTQKLLQLGENRSCGFVFAGDALFGRHSYRDLLTSFEKGLKGALPPIGNGDLPNAFREFLLNDWELQKKEYGLGDGRPPDSRIIIGGRGDAEDSAAFAVVLTNPGPDEKDVEIAAGAGAFALEGCPAPVHRMVFGIDGPTLELLEGSGVINAETAMRISETVTAAHPHRMAPYPFLGLRDAIDYVHFAIYIAVKYYKFLDGPSPCGGKIEIACVTSDRGFRWVTHKSLDWCISDEEGQTEYSPIDPHGHGR
jgi:hypothetical protein